MKSFFSKILVLTLLAFMASVSIAREDKSSGCWLSAGADSQKSFSKIDTNRFYCPVDISSTDFNIGRVLPTYEEGETPECLHTNQGGYSEISHQPVPALYTSYEKLRDIIKSSNSQSGIMHESITDFNARFPSCNNENDGYSLACQKPQAKPATAVAQVTLRELCLKEEIYSQNTRAIRIGYWIPDVNQCRIFDDSPSYVKTTAKQQSQTSTRDRAADDEFVCEGFKMFNRGWAGREYSGSWDKDYNCKKHVNKEECCKFAQQEFAQQGSSCHYLSWNPKGKCCCGPDMDFIDRGRGDSNIGLISIKRK